MTHFELTRTVLALADFTPPEGVEFVAVLKPKPGICRVSVALTTDNGGVALLEITEPPDESGLRTLYRIAEELRRAPTWAASLGLDLATIGGDGT